MGEGTSGVDPEEQLDEVSERIGKSRTRLDQLVSELDQRRHVLGNLKRGLAAHPLWALAAGLVGIGLAGGAVALAVQRQRQRQTLGSRAARLRSALTRAIDAPDRVAPAGSSVTGKLLTAAATAATSILVKRLVESATRPHADPPASGPTRQG
jgi:hypothetical protein